MPTFLPRTLSRKLVLGLGLALAIGSCRPHDHHEDQTFEGDFERLVLRNDIGPVRVVASAREGVRVRRVVSGWRGRLALSDHQEGDALVLEAGCAGLLPCSVDTIVEVPVGIDLSLRQGEGDVILDGLEGVVDVDLARGTLRGAGLAPAELALAVAQGDVALRFTRAPEHLRAAVGAGDVELGLPAGPYHYDVRTADGEISGLQAEEPSAEAPTVEVTVARGDIRLPSA